MRSDSAQGVTVVAAVAGTLLLTNKADQLKDSQRRTAMGVPPSTESDSLISSTLASIPSKTTSSSSLDAPSIQTQDGTLPIPNASAGGKGKFARPPRMSQALETEKLPGVHHPPVKVSEFARRLERAEQLESEVSRGKGQ
jgi:hypothetical protein